MAIQEVNENAVVQRCGSCERETRIPLASLAVGVSHGEHRDERIVPLPACAECGSVEFLFQGSSDNDHPDPGSFGHLHRLLVNHLHAELVQRGQVSPAARTLARHVDVALARPLAPDAIERWFPRGMKLPSASIGNASAEADVKKRRR